MQAVEKLEARLADRDSARVLQVGEGTPILYKERIVFAEDGTPLEYQECHNRGDKYTCTVVLRR
jgi:DNA-binding GntR family transcriptional regulator